MARSGGRLQTHISYLAQATWSRPECVNDFAAPGFANLRCIARPQQESHLFGDAGCDSLWAPDALAMRCPVSSSFAIAAPTDPLAIPAFTMTA